MSLSGGQISGMKRHIIADIERIKRPAIQAGVFKMLCAGRVYQSRIKSGHYVKTTNAESPHQITVHGIFVKIQADLHQASGCCFKNSLSMRSASASSAASSASTSCWWATW